MSAGWVAWIIQRSRRKAILELKGGGTNDPAIVVLGGIDDFSVSGRCGTRLRGNGAGKGAVDRFPGHRGAASDHLRARSGRRSRIPQGPQGPARRGKMATG